MSQPIIPPPAAAILATGLTEEQQNRERDPDEARDVEDATAVAASRRLGETLRPLRGNHHDAVQRRLVETAYGPRHGGARTDGSVVDRKDGVRRRRLAGRHAPVALPPFVDHDGGCGDATVGPRPQWRGTRRPDRQLDVSMSLSGRSIRRSPYPAAVTATPAD